MNPLRALALAMLTLTATLGIDAHASAQTPPSDAPIGTIEGELRLPSGPEGEGVSLEGAVVQLITLGGPEVTSLETPAEAGRFRFDAPAEPALTYFLRAQLQGVAYFSGAPIVLTPASPNETAAIEVFAATAEAPALRIASTTVTVLALDRAQSQVRLRREDVVLNPSRLTYVGGPDGVTLRLPLPESVLQAQGSALFEGLPAGGAGLAVDDSTLSSRVPLRPGETRIVSEYIAGYDAAADRYALRVTPPLPTQQIELRVPQRFVEAVRPRDGAVPGDLAVIDGEGVLVFRAPGEAAPGRSVVVDLEGLAGRNAPNPLTEPRGALLASMLALAVIALGVLASSRLPRARGGRNVGASA